MRKVSMMFMITILCTGISSCHLFIDGDARLDKIEYVDSTHVNICFQYLVNGNGPGDVEVTVDGAMCEIPAFILKPSFELRFESIYYCTLNKKLVSGDVVVAVPKTGAKLYGSVSLVVP